MIQQLIKAVAVARIYLRSVNLHVFARNHVEVLLLPRRKLIREVDFLPPRWVLHVCVISLIWSARRLERRGAIETSCFQEKVV